MTTTPLSPPHSHTDQSADDSPKPDRVEGESQRFYHSHFRLATQTNEPKQSRTAQSTCEDVKHSTGIIDTTFISSVVL